MLTAKAITGCRRPVRRGTDRPARHSRLKSLTNAARGPPSAVKTPAARPPAQALRGRKPVWPRSASAKKFLSPPGTQAAVQALYGLPTGVLALLSVEPLPVGRRPGLRIGSRPALPSAGERGAETGRNYKG
jgi:hypothetical protein